MFLIAACRYSTASAGQCSAAHGADRRRPDKGHWPVQPGAGFHRDNLRGRRFAQHHAFASLVAGALAVRRDFRARSVALAAVLLLWFLMPETQPVERERTLITVHSQPEFHFLSSPPRYG
mgnify:CR=1 FL=1